MSKTMRSKPVNLSAAKDMFVSAIRFAVSIEVPCFPFGDELRTSAQEQVDYMLGEDEDISLIISDDEVKSVVRMGVHNVIHSFETDLSSLLLNPTHEVEAADNTIMRRVSDLEWMCNVLPKMDLMKIFVSNWIAISSKILVIIEDEKFEHVRWGLKVKLIEVTCKVFEAVSYGSVIVPAPSRVQLLKTWFPYIRKMKPLLDSKASEETNFAYKMDEDLCQAIEGAIVSLVLTLPSNDQAGILADWIGSREVGYPDLSEAFEVWSYRSKSAKRRLVEGLHGHSDEAISS
ncbi:BTB/POZ domain-containing protein At3g05675 isoform X1 [Medicago truncatula]|uniref:BTB/POZ domain plant-like protein n=2 Tax=Medicago truncatula TaxID=3880 RepID=A0A072UTJ0_MEDTR|nr:BTB/POZ domain-containing protein At3g05675 isoform X1 [Medicago truncatula]XP_024633421.1 BTB/POZ domain-containing protein At3g05675 isoform X1 [Medicago truncatula]KEH32937.1 BTB/POZ domain plant-like protein [Medicago truncatula]